MKNIRRRLCVGVAVLFLTASVASPLWAPSVLKAYPDNHVVRFGTGFMLGLIYGKRFEHLEMESRSIAEKERTDALIEYLTGKEAERNTLEDDIKRLSDKSGFTAEELEDIAKKLRLLNESLENEVHTGESILGK